MEQQKEEGYIIKKIKEVDKEAAKWFEENGFQNATFKDLIYEAMNDVISEGDPAMFVVRKSKVWKVIKKYKDQIGCSPVKPKKRKISFSDEINTNPKHHKFSLERQPSVTACINENGGIQMDCPAFSSPCTETSTRICSTISTSPGVPDTIVKPEPISSDCTAKVRSDNGIIYTSPSSVSPSRVSASFASPLSTVRPQLSSTKVSAKEKTSSPTPQMIKDENQSNGQVSAPKYTSPTPQMIKDENQSNGQVSAPKYTIYKDNVLQSYVTGTQMMPEKLQHHLVRSTITNMIAVAQNHAGRLPSNTEITEMGKSLILYYKSLGSGKEVEESLCKRLQKKFYNRRKVAEPKPSVKATKNSNSKKKSTETVSNDSGTENEVELDIPVQNEDYDSTDTNDTVDTIDYSSEKPKEIADRYYKYLNKEQRKNKPNSDTLKLYLSLDYAQRRAFLKELPGETRTKAFLERYPVFKDHTHIIEEAGRVIGSGSLPKDFFTSCVTRLNEEKESILFFGIDEQTIKANVVMGQKNKLVCLLRNLEIIFQEKKKKAQNKTSKNHLFMEIEDHEEISIKKIKSKTPIILIDSSSCYLFKDDVILSTIPKLDEAVVALLSTFYLLDIEYPPNLQNGLCFLQQLVLNDNAIPKSKMSWMKDKIARYYQFKSSSD